VHPTLHLLYELNHIFLKRVLSGIKELNLMLILFLRTSAFTRGLLKHPAENCQSNIEEQASELLTGVRRVAFKCALSPACQDHPLPSTTDMPEVLMKQTALTLKATVRMPSLLNVVFKRIAMCPGPGQTIRKVSRSWTSRCKSVITKCFCLPELSI
jgi:hypothetical protein